MLKNYFKIAFRNLIRDKQFSFLNLIGLSAGLACVLLIYLWVSDELSIDKFNDKDRQLYEVLKKGTDGTGSTQIGKHTQGLLAQSMAEDLPEVEYAVPVRKDENNSILSFGEKHIKVKHEFAGKDFFRVFSYPLVNGNNNNVSGVSGVFLSDHLVLKLFNTTDVAGKTIRWEYKDGNVDFGGVYEISGVYRTPPANATDQFDMLVPFDLYAKKNAGGMGDITFWGSNMASTFLILKKGTNINAFNKKIEDFAIEKVRYLYPKEDLQKWEGTLFTRRYSDAYLYNNYVDGEQSGGRIEYVKLFSIIAIFILVIACINFMNLSTAKASRRLKEVGIKKVVGASRRSLVLQYIGESMLMAFASLLVAVGFVALLLTPFKEITGKDFKLQFDAGFIFSVAAITFITGLIAGSYPALYLSGFKPVSVLKGKLNTSSGESWIRKGLVVFQFTISVILIVSVLVVYRQMKLIQTTNLGYNKDNIIHFSNTGKLSGSLSPFISAVKSIPGVVYASDANGDFLGHEGHSGGGINWEGKDPNLALEYYGVGVDYDFMEMMDLQMAEGRVFSRSYGSDSSKVIFNESAIAAMGLKNPIGKTVSLWGRKKQIIGVVKDYHFESLYKKVGPAFLECFQNNENILVKIKAGTETETIARVEKLYKEYNEGLPFDFKFLDDDFQLLYSSEQRVAVLSRYFAGIAILISCLGLFGLAAFTAQRRQKEIGIRKVVGASAGSIATMLSTDFLKLVFVALLIAVPVSWWAANQWLQSFAYRIKIDAGIFLITAASVILITLLTISFQTIKAAIANPVKSLRTE
ncbi:MAG: ABC transporter permease [Chitinophagaceae bacterium]